MHGKTQPAKPAASKSDYGGSCQERRDLPCRPTALSTHPPVYSIISMEKLLLEARQFTKINYHSIH